MSVPLISTKLHVPRARPSRVVRLRLIERLNEGSTRPLTLLSAPPGFGKTTLLSEWITQCEHCVTWVSLDEGDNDPIRFWSYVISALQMLQSSIGAQALTLLQATQPLPIESVLSLLLNEIDAFRDQFGLALDDFHVIESIAIQRELDDFLAHMPAHMHLIISSRADVPLSVPRLRARDQLVELRAADLRFTVEEASAFLNQVMGLRLAPEQIALLEARTEGWIAGLQMAALSMQGHDDVSGFIAAFTGSHRFILDYLTEEVLQRQPVPIQNFLLQTSILKRLSAPLCDALVGQGGLINSQLLLEQLDKSNLFIIPLDDERRWYRYHHLFADLLKSRLQQLQPERVPEYHRRAAEWYEQNGLIEEAVEHALAAAHLTRDYERAIRLLEQIGQGLILRGEFKTLQNWLDALPEDVIRGHPWLGIGGAWALVLTNHLDEAERRVRDLEREIVALAPGGMALDGIHNWKMELVVLQAAIASGRRDTPRTIALASQALEQLPHDHVYRGLLALYLGYAYQDRGEGRLAQRAFAEAAQLSQATGSLLVAMIALGNSGQLHAARGQLRRANEFYAQSLQLAAHYGVDSSPITGPSLVGIGAVLCEQNDLEAAERTIREGTQRGAQLGGVVVDVFGDFILAQLKRAQGDIDGALQVIEHAEARLKSQSLMNRMRGLAAYRAQLWLIQGNPAAAAWAAEREREPRDDDVRWPWRLIEDLSLARVLITQGRGDPKNPTLLHAIELLETLQRAIEVEGRIGNLIEVLMLQALARQAQRDDASALRLMDRALSLAEPEGFVRLFVNGGTPMAELLAKVRGAQHRYAQRLLAAIRSEFPTRGDERQTTPPSVAPAAHPSLVEPLSKRELEVLRLVAASRSNQEIAEALVISINTVKTHLTRLYGKLNARNRLEAIERARELDLFRTLR